MVGTACLWAAAPDSGNTTLILAFLVVALIGAEFTSVFTNALLPELGAKREIGRISGSGWAMGYCGGLVSLVIVLCFLTPAPGSAKTLIGLDPVFGLDPAMGEGLRTGDRADLRNLVRRVHGAILPLDPRRSPPACRHSRGKEGLRNLGKTLAGLPSRRSLFAFLLSSMFYRDALNGLYFFGGIYAAGVLGWGTFQLGVFGIVGAVAGAAGAWVGGRVDGRMGPRPVILFTIAVLAVVSMIIISAGPGEILFIAVGSPESPSSLPDILFFVCGAAIGAAGGSLQASSRSMLVRQAGSGGAAEAFGMYALSGKATGLSRSRPGRAGHKPLGQPARRSDAASRPFRRGPGIDGARGRRWRSGGPFRTGIALQHSSRPRRNDGRNTPRQPEPNPGHRPEAIRRQRRLTPREARPCGGARSRPFRRVTRTPRHRHPRRA